MFAKVILNPYSGRWKGGQRRQEIEDALESVGINYEFNMTEGPGHATELAKKAVESGRFGCILGAGGDGTLNETINGLLKAEGGENVPFGIMPVGTANDLADNLNWPKDMLAAAKLIAKGKTRAMDVCMMNDHFFVNNAGLGLEPYVSTIQVKMTKLRGNVRYLAAALKGIMDNPQWEMEIEWDDGKYTGPATLVSIGNCARTGGIFYTVPNADPFDGKLSFIYGYISTRMGILKAFPMIMKPAEGNITEHPAVKELTTTWLRVRTKQPTPAHADGEVITEGAQDFEFKILPGRIKVIVA